MAGGLFRDRAVAVSQLGENRGQGQLVVDGAQVALPDAVDDLGGIQACGGQGPHALEPAQGLGAGAQAPGVQTGEGQAVGRQDAGAGQRLEPVEGQQEVSKAIVAIDIADVREDLQEHGVAGEQQAARGQIEAHVAGGMTGSMNHFQGPEGGGERVAVVQEKCAWERRKKGEQTRGGDDAASCGDLLLAEKTTSESEWVLPSPECLNLHVSMNSNLGFPEACKRAEIEDFRFHDLRHSFATLFVIRTGDKEACRVILGHSKSATTDKYVNIPDSHIRESMKKFEENK